jgi:phenylalanyl-tRNA synthetase beta chain
MLEAGQPLHAFDYNLLGRQQGEDGPPTVVIRRANNAEEFTTIDGQKRALTDSMLVIANGERAIALAGVMGGKNKIRKSTRAQRRS